MSEIRIIGDSPYIDTYLSYYGAYIDGEGHIGIKKLHSKKARERGFSPIYSERVSVASTNELIIRSFNDIVIGHIYCHKSKSGAREYWSWEVTDKKAVTFLKIIEPYLKTKTLQAKVVLALTKLKEKNKRKKITPQDLKLREDLYKVLRRLHGI